MLLNLDEIARGHVTPENNTTASDRWPITLPDEALRPPRERWDARTEFCRMPAKSSELRNLRSPYRSGAALLNRPVQSRSSTSGSANFTIMDYSGTCPGCQQPFAFTVNTSHKTLQIHDTTSHITASTVKLAWAHVLDLLIIPVPDAAIQTLPRRRGSILDVG